MRGFRSLLHQLWRDEIGVILSAEAALLGTVAVIGATVGLSAVNKSVNDELTEVASAFRSLDQSYHIEGRHGCSAWTAGSSYRQPCVEESLEELHTFVGELEQHQHDSEHGRHHEEDSDDDGRRRNRHDRDDSDDRDSDADDDASEDDDAPPGRRRDRDDSGPREEDEPEDGVDVELRLDVQSSGEFAEPIRDRPAAGE
jgi:hypothetical protein